MSDLGEIQKAIEEAQQTLSEYLRPASDMVAILKRSAGTLGYLAGQRKMMHLALPDSAVFKDGTLQIINADTDFKLHMTKTQASNLAMQMLSYAGWNHD